MDTRERLKEAAAKLLDAGGEGAVTLRAVAQAVGLSHNAPYRHFPDRAALLAGVAERDLELFSGQFVAIEASALDPVDKVRAALELLVTYGREHPARYRLLFSDPAIGSRGGGLEEVALRMFAALAGLVGKAQAAGRLPMLPTAALTGLIFAATHGLLDLEAGGRMREEKGIANALDGASLLLTLIAPSDGIRREKD